MSRYLKVSPELYETLREPKPGAQPPALLPTVALFGVPVVIDHDMIGDEWAWGLRCWKCGVEPEESHAIRSWEGELIRTLTQWPPATDHVHGAEPPSPADLLAAADKLMAGIRATLAE